MNTVGWTTLAGGTVLVGLMLWPTGPSAREGWMPLRSGVRSAFPWGSVAVPAGAFAVVMPMAGPVLAAAGAVTGWLCARLVAAQRTSRRNLRVAEGVSRLVAMTANQATVAPTVQAALAASAPLVDGRVGEAARRLVAECATLGVPAAAARFAEALPEAQSARWMADCVSVTAVSGGAWVDTMWKLEAEAAAAAATARLFHRRVAAVYPQVVVTVMVGTALVGGLRWVVPDAWVWLTVGVGQAVALAATLVVALLVVALILSPARRAA